MRNSRNLFHILPYLDKVHCPIAAILANSNEIIICKSLTPLLVSASVGVKKSISFDFILIFSLTGVKITSETKSPVDCFHRDDTAGDLDPAVP